MAKGFEIREADLRDLADLAVLFDGYRQFYNQAADLEGATSFLKERFRQSESKIFIAVTPEQSAVGFTQLYPLFSSVRMRPVWILNDLYVLREARGKGVGQHLIQAAESWGRSVGAAALELSTAKDNLTAKSVYDALGWELDTTYDHYSIRL